MMSHRFFKLPLVVLSVCLTVSCGKAPEAQKSDSSLNSIAVGDGSFSENDMQYEKFTQVPSLNVTNSVSKNVTVTTGQGGQLVANVSISDQDLGVQGSGLTTFSFNLNP